jgi:hypothetical protein
MLCGAYYGTRGWTSTKLLRVDTIIRIGSATQVLNNKSVVFHCRHSRYTGKIHRPVSTQGNQDVHTNFLSL